MIYCDMCHGRSISEIVIVCYPSDASYSQKITLAGILCTLFLYFMEPVMFCGIMKCLDTFIFERLSEFTWTRLSLYIVVENLKKYDANLLFSSLRSNDLKSNFLCC